MEAMEREDLVLLHGVWQAYEGGSLLGMANQRLVQTPKLSMTISHPKDKAILSLDRLALPSNSHNLFGSNRQAAIVVDIDTYV